MKILIISGGSIDEMWGRKWVADYEPDYCIAADSGLVMADKLGLTVDLLLGDYDSVDKKIFEKYNRNTKTITYPCEKDYTDTHLALKKAIEKIKKLQDTSKDSTEDEIAIIGATGTRYDHAFTNIFVLDESLEAGIRCAIYDKNNKIYLADKSFEIRKDKQFGDYLSFAPMTPEAGLSLSGVKYPLDRYTLRQGESICQSNEITEIIAKVEIFTGKLVVFETRD
jgi:thiamine pyrophosphokinase